jgi:HAD superfamily hydrolase (TIGR01509 family)
VLIDSSPIHAWAFQQVFSRAGVTGFEYGRWAGLRTREVIDTVLAQSGCHTTAEQRAEMAAAKSRLALERMRAEPPLVPGCADLLRDLQTRFRLALASSASRPSVELFLQHSGCRECFSAVLTGEDVRLPKPAPEVYERAASLLGLLPRQVLVVEDALSGVSAARHAGCRVWAVRGTANGGDLLDAGAERLVDSVLALRDLVP